MPDISMCMKEDCPMNMKCYRFTAKPNDWQSYGAFKPDDDGTCTHFWEIDGKEVTSEYY